MTTTLIIESSTTAHASSTIEFKPKIRVSSEYDDNLYTENKHTSTTNKGVITRIRPSLDIKKTNERNNVQLHTHLEQQVFSNDSDNNNLNGAIALSTRQQLTDNMRWHGKAAYSRSHARRGDNEADPLAMAKNALPLNRYQAQTSIDYTSGNFILSPRLGLLKHDYQNVERFNGTTINQDIRDRVQYTVGAKATYSPQTNTRVYLDGEFLPRKYDEKKAKRNSKGGKALIGFTHTPTQNIHFGAALGYLGRSYDNNNFKDINTLATNAHLRWTIQEATQLRFSLSRDINETTSANTGGILSTRASARLTHTLTQDLKAHISTRYTYNDYVGGKGADNGLSDRIDKLLTFGIGATYLLTEGISLALNYEYTSRKSNRRISEYDRNIARLGLTYDF